ncbi:MAG: hypothetical protein NW241_01000 [Bacteroidia bacterium]|nr:hypothetical protein [Bacteroidia bacterium]
MNALGTILLIALVGGVVYLVYLGIRKTLAEDSGRSRRQRRGARRR